MVVKVYECCLYVTNSYTCHQLICVSRILVFRLIPSSSQPDYHSAPLFVTWHVYVYTRIYTCIHICMHTYIYKCMCIYHIPMPPSSPPDSHSAQLFAMRHIYLCTHVYMYIYIDIYICVYIIYLYLLRRHQIISQHHRLQRDIYMYIHVYTCIYTCIYIYIHTYIYVGVSHIHTSLIATGLPFSATLCNATYICIYTYIHIYLYMHIFDIYVCVCITYVYLPHRHRIVIQGHRLQ